MLRNWFLRLQGTDEEVMRKLRRLGFLRCAAFMWPLGNISCHFYLTFHRAIISHTLHYRMDSNIQRGKETLIQFSNFKTKMYRSKKHKTLQLMLPPLSISLYLPNVILYLLKNASLTGINLCKLILVAIRSKNKNCNSTITELKLFWNSVSTIILISNLHVRSAKY